MSTFTFQSRRLGMRPWQEGDLEAFYAIFGDERVIWWRPQRPSLKEARAALERVIAGQDSPLRGLGRFAAVSLEQGSIVGNVILRPAGFAEGIEVGYHFAFDAWGRGYATEAAQAAIAYGFEVLGLERILATVALQNARSLRVMEKLAMTPTYEAEHAGMPHRMFECRREHWNGTSGR